MVVQSDHSFWIMETLDVLIWFCKVLRSVYVLKHVHIPMRKMLKSRIHFFISCELEFLGKDDKKMFRINYKYHSKNLI